MISQAEVRRQPETQDTSPPLSHQPDSPAAFAAVCSCAFVVSRNMSRSREPAWTAPSKQMVMMPRTWWARMPRRRTALSPGDPVVEFSCLCHDVFGCSLILQYCNIAILEYCNAGARGEASRHPAAAAKTTNMH